MSRSGFVCISIVKSITNFCKRYATTPRFASRLHLHEPRRFTLALSTSIHWLMMLVCWVTERSSSQDFNTVMAPERCSHKLKRIRLGTSIIKQDRSGKTYLELAEDQTERGSNKRRRPIEFQVGDFVLLKVSPWKGVIHFHKRGKLSPRFIGPFKIIARVGNVAYRFELPEDLKLIHNTVHVSYLRKCLANESTYVPLEDIEVDDKLNYVEKPVEILDHKVKLLCNKTIDQVKVKWKHRKGDMGVTVFEAGPFTNTNLHRLSSNEDGSNSDSEAEPPTSEESESIPSSVETTDIDADEPEIDARFNSTNVSQTSNCGLNYANDPE
ncbi:hypothetical protein E3N88_21499 [Mikania micrantha]|uniref:Tf2-1-like SH3-like domain-containing protein n=1 Tax=Mikania micrantha TaxID=192012 RepID=A0A5N6NJZ7_9ASTR|nr:hypothetical protein E3N88_21499 [Mikania micrantha]